MSEEELIRSIRADKKERERAIRWLYLDNELRNGVAKVINSYDEYQISDIFNLAVVQLMKNIIKREDFSFSRNYRSYIYGIARNLYYQSIQKDKKVQVVKEVEDYDYTSYEDINLVIIDDERNELIQKILGQLGESCKDVLYAWAQGDSMKDIAQDMDYKSSGYARKKKHLCMKKLLEYIDEHHYIKELLQH